MGLRQRFIDHPASVDETYLEHFKVATHFARELFGAAVACSIHAVLPWLHEKTASTRVRALCDEMNSGRRGELYLLSLPGADGLAEERELEPAL